MTRRANDVVQEPFVLAYDHVQVTATTTVKLYEARRRMVIDSVKYINPTGLAEHADNWFVVALNQGATVVADWSTDVGQEGTIDADTFVDLSLSATGADLVIEKDEVLSLVLTEGGTATLPAGRIVVEGRLI